MAINAKASTWAQAASQGRATKAADKTEDSTTDPVELATKDIKVELNDDGDVVNLSLADQDYTLSLDVATELAGQLADVNPDVDTEGSDKDAGD